LSRQTKPLHSQQHPLCPTKNPHRSTLRPFSDAFTLRTPGFAQRHRLGQTDKTENEPATDFSEMAIPPCARSMSKMAIGSFPETSSH
jgi:hypothetical protein